MKLKSLMIAVVMLAFAGASLAKTPVHAKKAAHKKVQVIKHHHKVAHKRAVAK